MKKSIIGLVAVAATIGLLPVIRRKAHKVREHCEQMAAKCKQMMAQSGADPEAAGMREHSEATAAQVGGRSEALSTA